MTVCSKCNAPLGPDDLFCGECGTKVEAPEAPHTQPTAAPQTSSKAPIVIGVIACVGILVVAAKLLSNHPDDEMIFEEPPSYAPEPAPTEKRPASEKDLQTEYELKKEKEIEAHEAQERARLARPVNEGDRGFVSILGLQLRRDPVYTIVDGARTTGMYLSGTLPQSGAREAGLENGDIIIEVQGDPIASRDDVARGIRRARVDGLGKVLILVLKGGTQPTYVAVRLVQLPIAYD